jgi:hypothetical protein
MSRTSWAYSCICRHSAEVIMGQKSPSGHMGVGRGSFRQALLQVLLDRHSPDDPTLMPRVLDELGDECVYCGIPGADVLLQLDHLWPKKVGGLWVIGNLVPSCPTCNSERRESPWEGYLRTSVRGLSRRTPAETEAKVRAIHDYMVRHGQRESPDLDRILTPAEKQLRQDFALLLEALSDGALATAGIPKTKNILFDDPATLFRTLVDHVQSSRCGPTKGAV